MHQESLANDQVAHYVEQAAQLANLPLRTEDKPGVIAHFSRIQAIAEQVNTFPLPEGVESAPVFTPSGL